MLCDFPRALRHAAFAATCGMLTHSAVAQMPAMAPPEPRPEATLDAAPAGFDVRRADVPGGRVERVEFDSTVVGGKRPAMVYLPPGYAPDREYPVLYLLHGIGGNQTHWTAFGGADVILDNLIADGLAVPMIVVMPHGRASNAPPMRFGPPDQATGRPAERAGAGPGGGPPGGMAAMQIEFEAYAAFERELLNDLIPFVEARYSASGERSRRALAGLSMGGGQALNFGLGNVEVFAWVGGFSSAPITRRPAELVADPAPARRLDLLWVSCGNEDPLFNISLGVHEHLAMQNVPHAWHVDAGAHTFEVWKNDLYHFASLLFR